MSSTLRRRVGAWRNPAALTGPGRGLRSLAILVTAAVTLFACTGVLTSLVFQQYSTLKWAITVAGPLAVLMLLLTRRPVTYLAAAALIALPFVPLEVRFRDISVLPVLVLVGVGVVVGFLSTERGSERSALTRSRLGAAGGVVALLLLPSGVRGLAPGEWFVQVAMVAGLAYLVVRACHLDPQGQLFVTAAVGGLILVQALIAISEFRTGHRFDPYGGGVATFGADYFFSYGDVFRPVGAFFDPISLGNVLALGCPLLVALACYPRYPPLLRGWFALSSLVAAGALVLTLSRMSWVATAVGLVTVLLLSPMRERARQIGFLGVAAVIVSVTAVSLAGPDLLLRFQSIFNPTGTAVSTAEGDETRKQLWQSAFEAFADHPLLGVGSGNLQGFLVQTVGGAGLFAHAHSTYLQNLAESGLLGAIAIVVLGWTTMSELAGRIRRDRFSDPIARACAGSLVALAVVWTTDYTIRYTAVLACMAVPFILLATRSVRVAAPMAAAETRPARPVPEVAR